jgi:hypothetical protein
MEGRRSHWLDQGNGTPLRRLGRRRRAAYGAVVRGLLALALALGVTLPSPTPVQDRDGGGRSTYFARQAGYGQRPLQFEANHGQAAAPVDFLERAPGYTLFLISAEAVPSLRSGSGPGTVYSDERAAVADEARTTSADYTARAIPPVRTPAAEADVLRVQLGDGSTRAAVGEMELQSRVNYLLGDNRTPWRTGVPTYGLGHDFATNRVDRRLRRGGKHFGLHASQRLHQ